MIKSRAPRGRRLLSSNALWACGAPSFLLSRRSWKASPSLAQSLARRGEFIRTGSAAILYLGPISTAGPRLSGKRSISRINGLPYSTSSCPSSWTTCCTLHCPVGTAARMPSWTTAASPPRAACPPPFPWAAAPTPPGLLCRTGQPAPSSCLSAAAPTPPGLLHRRWPPSPSLCPWAADTTQPYFAADGGLADRASPRHRARPASCLWMATSTPSPPPP
jgi:hypothetical protein